MGEPAQTQTFCPWNGEKFVQITKKGDYRPDGREAEDGPEAPPDLPGTEMRSLVEMMAMTRSEWDVWTRGPAIRRAGYAGFKRNVAVAIGTWLAELKEPPDEAVAVLRDALADEEPLVQEHAAWALKRGGKQATVTRPAFDRACRTAIRKPSARAGPDRGRGASHGLTFP